jgi:hypothetical protein
VTGDLERVRQRVPVVEDRSPSALALVGRLSWEVSQLEEETRVLAEEIALIRTQLEERSVIPERDAPATEIGPKAAGDD